MQHLVRTALHPSDRSETNRQAQSCEREPSSQNQLHSNTLHNASAGCSASDLRRLLMFVCIVCVLCCLRVRFWRRWLNSCAYTGRWRETVRRSALLLKLMTYEPTGAIIQGPTCCLPTVVGTPGFDCRCVSLRDASFTIASFLKLGFRTEASAWMHWLEQRCEQSQGPDGKMPMLFSIHGETNLTPVVVPDVPGYKGSGPVTVGQ